MPKPRAPKHPQDGPDDDRGEPHPQPPEGDALAFGVLPGQAFAQANHSLLVRTRGQGFVDITGSVSDWLARIGAENGLLTLFIAHTSASLTIQENADPDVRYDLRAALERLAPESGSYRHSMEGPDDMPAHIKAMLTSVSLSIPVIEGRTALGTWQGIYVIEHRSHPHDRKLELHFIGVRQT